MRSRVKKLSHILERSGLAMAGAACGLFVGVQVGTSIAAFTSEGFLLVMMIAGAAGFYLGIDTPPAPFVQSIVPTDVWRGKVDFPELLSALGTFLATLTAFASVVIIVLREKPELYWTVAIMLGWSVGVLMQVVAGAIDRMRR
jgi:hypothetical protein